MPVDCSNCARMGGSTGCRSAAAAMRKGAGWAGTGMQEKEKADRSNAAPRSRRAPGKWAFCGILTMAEPPCCAPGAGLAGRLTLDMNDNLHQLRCCGCGARIPGDQAGPNFRCAQCGDLFEVEYPGW